MELPKRKPTRLKGFDYSSSGYYFITICTHERKPIFSKITKKEFVPAQNHLTALGQIAEAQLLELEEKYAHVQVHKHIIMPNHIHAIIILNKPTEPHSLTTLSDIVCAYKSMTTRLCHQLQSGPIFQTSFHDHIIRGQQDYMKIWQYIDSNAEKWENDCFYCSE